MATTSKTKAPAKKVKQSDTRNNPVKENTTLQKNKPTEEQIRRKAQEIYYQRQSRGEYGTELDDWQRAERILSEESI